MKRIFSIFAVLVLAIFCLQTNAFIGMTVKAGKVKPTTKKVDVVFVINSPQATIEPIANKPGCYKATIGKIENVAFISSPRSKVSGEISVDQFVHHIDWKTFTPNGAITANLTKNGDNRQTWVFVFSHAQYDPQIGLTFELKAKPKNHGTDYSANSAKTVYDVTMFVDSMMFGSWGGW